MSGIVGIFQRDGHNADELLLMRLLRAIAHRGPDGTRHWVQGRVALGQQLLCTTPEAWREKLPLRNDEGTLCLVLDGRVDNREELTEALSSKGFLLREDTDGEIILRAYECWGEDCPAKIVGDFAFVIWDERKQQLFCARDTFGVKPFYYYCDDKRFLCGSEIQQLLRDPAISWTPNEEMIGEFLADALTGQTETLYRNIFRLPPAHSLTISANKTAVQRYWYPDRLPAIRYRQEAEYSEHFLAIFAEALRASLRTDGIVGAHLSGGLDSSSVVCLAHSLLQQGQVAAADLETFSLEYPGRDCDESEYINAVLSQASFTAHKFKADEPPCDYSGAVFWPTPPNGTDGVRLNELAQQRGIRVMLTGIGGDEWLQGSQFHYADLLRSGRVIALLQRIRAEQNEAAFFRASHPFWQYGVKPLIHPFVPELLLNWRKRFVTSLPDNNFLTSEFIEHIQLAARLQNKDRAVAFKQRALQEIYEFATGAWQTFRFELDDQIKALFGVEARHPLNDRRIAEFALAIPEEQRSRGKQTKFILRQAMQNILPDSIRSRTDKADFAHLFPALYQATDGDAVFAALQIGRNGWVQSEKVYAAYQTMMERYIAGDISYAEKTWQLWAIFGVELWWRNTLSQTNQSLVTTTQLQI